MNRAHNARQARESLLLAINYFDNITIDLIYGTPELTNEKWKQNVETAVSLNIPHLSCYALTVEPKTPLDKRIKRHQSENVNPDKQSEQFLLLMKWMEESGYEHYEISNFSRQGYRSQHNSSYWSGKNIWALAHRHILLMEQNGNGILQITTLIHHPFQMKLSHSKRNTYADSAIE